MRLKYICFFLLLGFTSCMKFDDLKSPVDGLKILINYDIFETFISFRFVDSATGELIGASDNQNVKLTVSGVSSDAIVDQMGNHDESYLSVFGLLSLALNPKDIWAPSSGNILSFDVVASCDNYKDVVMNIRIDSVGKYEYRVMLEKKNTDVTGVKTYCLPVEFDVKGKTTEEINIISSGNEADLFIQKGSEFFYDDGSVASFAKFYFTTYADIYKAPVSGAFLSDIVLSDGTVIKKALDAYRVVGLNITDGKNSQIVASARNPISVRFRIDPGNKILSSVKKLRSGENFSLLRFDTGKNLWDFINNFEVRNDSIGFYVETGIIESGYYAICNLTDLVELNGNFSFSLDGSFPYYPVSAAVNLYRMPDYKYIGSRVVDVKDKSLSNQLSFFAPVNTPLRIHVFSNSGSNPFNAIPGYFDIEAGVNTLGSHDVLLSSTAAEVSGRVNLVFDGKFPDEEFWVRVMIYSSSGNLLWQNNYLTGRNKSAIDFSTYLVSDVDAYVKVEAVDRRNKFEVSQGPFGFNTKNGKNINMSFNISPVYSVVNLNFDFNRDAGFINSDFYLRADLVNTESGDKEDAVTFHVLPSVQKYNAELLVTNKNHYTLNLKRVDGSVLFSAYPYEFSLDAGSQSDFSLSTHLSAVSLENINLSVRVVCGQSEIIPSLHGYYRTVWDDVWNEADIVNGKLSGIYEFNSTYVVGIILNGKMETMTYLLDKKDIDMVFPLEDGQCAMMGW